MSLEDDAKGSPFDGMFDGDKLKGEKYDFAAACMGSLKREDHDLEPYANGEPRMFITLHEDKPASLLRPLQECRRCGLIVVEDPNKNKEKTS